MLVWGFLMRRIYMDHAATTPVRNEVLKAMQPYLSKKFGNPSSLHFSGQEAKHALEESRAKVAGIINTKPSEIIFTSGGTEANNLALIGTAFANRSKGKHLITTKIEHHAILDVCKWLEKQGFDITYLPVDKQGMIDTTKVEDAIRSETILVSIMHANNEIGTIQDIAEIGKICREKGVYFHTDAVQAVGKIPIDVNKMNIDMLSMSSHKLYGPKGVGALFVKSGVKIESVIHGGGQEFGLRSGTENIPGIVGFAKAAELAKKEMRQESKRLITLRDRLIKGLLKIENSWLNGHPTKRLPNNVHLCFKFIEGEALVLSLSDLGIAASTGSACSSKSLEPSHVLLALGLKHEEAHGSLRLTLGRYNSKEDVDYVVKGLPGIVNKLRKISPFKKNWS